MARREIEVTPLINTHIGAATGYAPEPDWKHGMYQGDLVVQGVDLDTERDADRFYGIVDAAARFETNTGDVGYGLHEYMFLGPVPQVRPHRHPRRGALIPLWALRVGPL